MPINLKEHYTLKTMDRFEHTGRVLINSTSNTRTTACACSSFTIWKTTTVVHVKNCFCQLLFCKYRTGFIHPHKITCLNIPDTYHTYCIIGAERTIQSNNKSFLNGQTIASSSSSWRTKPRASRTRTSALVHIVTTTVSCKRFQ